MVLLVSGERQRVSMKALSVYNELIATCGYPLRNLLACIVFL